MERAAQDRVGLAVAVDRVVKAVGRTIGREQQGVDAPEPKTVKTIEQLLELWEKYSIGLPSASLDLRVRQRALRDGCSAKEVTLMLLAGSGVVRQLYEMQGKKRAMEFAARMVQAAGMQQTRPPQDRGKDQGLSLEIGD